MRFWNIWYQKRKRKFCCLFVAECGSFFLRFKPILVFVRHYSTSHPWGIVQSWPRRLNADWPHPFLLDNWHFKVESTAPWNRIQDHCLDYRQTSESQIFMLCLCSKVSLNFKHMSRLSKRIKLSNVYFLSCLSNELPQRCCADPQKKTFSLPRALYQFLSYM